MRYLFAMFAYDLLPYKTAQKLFPPRFKVGDLVSSVDEFGVVLWPAMRITAIGHTRYQYKFEGSTGPLTGWLYSIEIWHVDEDYEVV